MKKILPIAIALVGLAGGVAAGTAFKPGHDLDAEIAHGEAGDAHKTDAHGDSHADKGHAKAKDDHGGEHGAGDGEGPIYVAFERPFFAPITRPGGKRVLVRLDLHLEVDPSLREAVLQHEPKLRDGFLGAVLAFSQSGGFSHVGAGDGFEILGDDLLTSARAILGPQVRKVLIGEILSRT